MMGKQTTGNYKIQISSELSKRIHDLREKEFGRLTVLDFLGTFHTFNRRGERVNNLTLWLCRCQCKNLVEASSRHLTQGCVQSCGCLRIDRLRAAMSPLSEADVEEIRRRYDKGDALSEIATDYQVTLACISAIGRGVRR
jgi:hypothetical protein